MMFIALTIDVEMLAVLGVLVNLNAVKHSICGCVETLSVLFYCSECLLTGFVYFVPE